MHHGVPWFSIIYIYFCIYIRVHMYVNIIGNLTTISSHFTISKAAWSRRNSSRGKHVLTIRGSPVDCRLKQVCKQHNLIGLLQNDILWHGKNITKDRRNDTIYNDEKQDVSFCWSSPAAPQELIFWKDGQHFTKKWWISERILWQIQWPHTAIAVSWIISEESWILMTWTSEKITARECNCGNPTLQSWWALQSNLKWLPMSQNIQNHWNSPSDSWILSSTSKPIGFQDSWKVDEEFIDLLHPTIQYRTAQVSTIWRFSFTSFWTEVHPKIDPNWGYPRAIDLAES